MCAHNRVNNSPPLPVAKFSATFPRLKTNPRASLSQNWDAQHTGTTAPALVGLGKAMSGRQSLLGSNFTDAHFNQCQPISRRDDRATRIIESWHKLRQK
ncbi:hypothetical protein V8C42DRAFT_322882 [Trichoderma barbatum]